MLLSRRLLAMALLLAAPPVQATQLRVPDDFSTVALALAASSSGDTVQVACGAYLESGLLLPAGVTLRGAESPACVILDAQGVARVLTVERGEGVSRLEGIRFANGGADFGAGVQAGGIDELEIRDCEFTANVASQWGGALNLYASGPVTIERCRFEANVAPSGAAIARTGAYAAPFLVLDSSFVANVAEPTIEELPAGGSALVLGYTVGQVRGCVFDRNRSRWPKGAGLRSPGCFGWPSTVYLNYSDVEFDHCTFHRNTETDLAICSATGLVRNSVFFLESELCYEDLDGDFTFACVDVYRPNSPVDQCGFPAEDGGSLALDPCFCDPAAGDFHLAADSAVLRGDHADGCEGPLGAFGEGCASRGCGSVPVESAGWGRLKSRF